MMTIEIIKWLPCLTSDNDFRNLSLLFNITTVG